jgi:hypothetical protein
MLVLKSKSGSMTTSISIRHYDGLVIQEEDMVGTIIDPSNLNRITLSDDAYIEEEYPITLTRKDIETILKWHDKGYTDINVDKPLFDKLKEIINSSFIY